MHGCVRDWLVLFGLATLTAIRAFFHLRRPANADIKVLDPAIWLGVLGIFFTHFIASLSYVSSRSMLPTLGVHDVLVINRAAYGLGRPMRGDIAVFLPAESVGGRHDLVKRIVGIGGDAVEVKGGKLYLNDLPVEDGCEASKSDFPRHLVAPGCVFFMGDNRNNSADSRFFGDVSEKMLLGRADLRIWPLARWGRP